MIQKFLILFILLLLPINSYGMDSLAERPENPYFAFGTLNVIICNEKNLVAITDSRATSLNQNNQVVRTDDTAQKLFQLSDSVGCTIAGFGAASFPEQNNFNIRSGDIIDYFKIKAKLEIYKPTTKEISDRLIFFIKDYLGSFISAQAAAGLNTNYQKLTLTVFGFDDDQPKVFQTDLIILTSPKVEIVEKPLNPIYFMQNKIYLAGINNFCNIVIDNPQMYSKEPAVKDYISDSSNLENMTNFANYLMNYTIEQCKLYKQPYVGGDSQVAILISKEKKFFLKSNVHKIPERWNFITANEFPGGYQSRDTRFKMFLHNKFSGDTNFVLDGGYFSENTFDNCILHYNGGPLVFKNNRVLNRTLFLIKKGIYNESVEMLKNNFRDRIIYVDNPELGPL